MVAALTLLAMAVLAPTAAADGPAGADVPAGPVQAAAPAIVPLRLSGDQHCLPDASLCFAVVVDANSGTGRYRLKITDPASMVEGEQVPLPQSDEGRGSVTLWPFVVALQPVEAGGPFNREWLVGVLTENRAMYSGGGGEAFRLHLHRLGVNTNGGAVGGELGNEVLSLPWRSSILIRACFSETDSKRRRGACHDEYEFGANLKIADSDEGSGGFPVLGYQTQATAFPQTARRSEDSSAASPLTTADLSLWRDPECSYTRTLRFNPASERYEMDRIAPDCSSYTAP